MSRVRSRAADFALAAVLTACTAGAELVEAAEAAAPAAGGTLYPGRAWEPGAPRYGSMVSREVPVTMDDGVVLRASVAYPTDLASGQRATGRFPVVIEHTPYVQLNTNAPVEPISFFPEHGYIYVVVRARGMGTSGGEVARLSAREGLDGKAIVDWAAHRLEGSDGRIGLVGCSYPAGIALADAAHVGRNSPLKAVVATCNGLNLSGSVMQMTGGLMTTGFWNYTPIAPALLWGNSPASIRFSERMLAEIPAGGDAAYGGGFSRDRAPLRWAQSIVDNDIPVLLWSGWQDTADVKAQRTYVALQNAYSRRSVYGPMAANQAATPRYQIIMGNWRHAQGLDVGIYLQWFETWLKGVDTGMQNTREPMHLYEPGSERWINLAGYPAVAEYTSWYLSDSRTMQSATPQDGSNPLVWGDPAQAGSKLSFTTPTLAEGATLAGPISATIFAKSSNTNLVLLTHLFEVAADGTATQIAKGVVLGSQHEIDRSRSWTDKRGTITWPWLKLERDNYLKPGNVYRLDIALSPIVRAIKPGHALRLDLTTQTPAEVCPANGSPTRNGTDPCRLTKPQQATVPGGTYQIMFGRQWPSALNLPQLPYKAFAEAAAGVPPTAWNENQRRRESRQLTLPLDWGSSSRP